MILSGTQSKMEGFFFRSMCHLGRMGIMMISWIGNCHFRPVNSSLQTENWNCVQHLDKVITFRHACDMVQIQPKNPWAETKCTEIYFQFSFVQISPLPSYCCMHLLLWACLFLWALTLAIPSFDFWSITKLIKRQWQKSLFACGCRCCSFFFGEGAGGDDFTVRASILLPLINFIAFRHHFFTLLSGWYLTCKT